MSDKLVVVGLVVLLLGAWNAMHDERDRVARVVFLAAGAAFVASLVVPSLTALFLLLTLALIGRALFSRARASSRGRALAGALGAAGLLLLGLAIVVPDATAATDGGGDPAAETRAALARGNLFEARFWGERWVAETPDALGDAALLLAQVDWDLGHHGRARAIAAEVAARGVDSDVRRTAGARLERWKEPK